MEHVLPAARIEPRRPALTMRERRIARQLAAVLGPTMVVTTVTEWVNLHIWAGQLPVVTYLNGMLLFIGGLVVLRLHPTWRRSWTTAVTLAGWLLTGAGILRMAFPEAPQPRDGLAATSVIALVLGYGCLLTWLGYRQLPAHDR
jgi:drug/metabolite transporter (DMT)-like permease